MNCSRNFIIGTTTALAVMCGSIYMLYTYKGKEEVEEEKVIELNEIEKIVDEVVVNKVGEEEEIRNEFNFDYSCCEPISTSIELLELLNCDKKIYNFYELIWSINNYLYEHELLELQFVTLNDETKKLLSIDEISLPYHIFIEKILDTHVHKYI